MKKIILNCILIFTLLFNNISIVYASTNGDTPPRQTRNINFRSVDSFCAINSRGTITAEVDVNGYSSVTTSLKCTMYLEEYKNGSWSIVKSWSSSTSNLSLSMSKTATAKKGTTYRVRAYVTANGTENNTSYSSSVTY